MTTVSERKSNKLVIPGVFPTMNEIVEASKQHWSKYHDMKHTYTDLVAWHAKHLPAMGQVDIFITWYCKDRRQDKDNIMAGQKFIFDGLVAVGRLKNDGWNQIRNVTHWFDVDKANPRVKVELWEVEADAS